MKMENLAITIHFMLDKLNWNQVVFCAKCGWLTKNETIVYVGKIFVCLPWTFPQ